MFKLILLTKRKPGMSMADFKEYYETHHAPLATALYPQMRRYIRTYLTPIEHPVYEGGPYPSGEPPFDCITEVHFEDRAGFESVMASMIADTESAKLLSDDEARMFHVSTIWRLAAEDCE